MRMKKQIIIETILIIAIMLMQMVLPTIYSIATETELVTIQFQDVNMYNAMVESLGNKVSSKNDANKTIFMTQTNIDSVRELDFSEHSITNINGIECFTSLETLWLSENEISDISILRGLTNLVSLNLTNNDISNYNVLSELTSLRHLYLGENNISDISMLSGLTNLVILSLESNNITDISILSGLTNLEDLDLRYNKISNINALSGLTKLYQLDLDNNQISDISVLSNLTNLHNLGLGNNNIENIGALSGLTKLVRLYLNSNKINDISTVKNFINITKLDLDSNKINDISSLSDLSKISFLDLMYNNTTVKGDIGDTIKLPQMFLDAQNESSMIYSEEGLELVNCKFNQNKDSIIIEKIPASVLIKSGEARASYFEITKNGESSNKEEKPNNPEEDDILPEEKEFIVGRDNNSFLHTTSDKCDKPGFLGITNYQIPSSYFDMLTKNSTEGEKKKVISMEYSEWGGSCYGIAAMMGLAYYGRVDLSSIQEGIINFYDLEEPYKQKELLNLIQTYYLSQFLDLTDEINYEYRKPKFFGLIKSKDNDYENLESFLEDLINTTKDEVVQFTYYWGGIFTEGHSILACGSEKLEDGSYRVKLYNMNSVNLENTIGSFEYMTVSSDFKQFSIPNINNEVSNNNYKSLDFIKFSDYNLIEVGEEGKERALTENNITIGFKANSNFEIANSKNQTLTYNGEKLSGDIEVLDIDLIAKGENEAELEITIPYDENLTYKENNDKTDLYVHDNNYYMSISGENIDKVTVDLDNTMKVEGENCTIEAQIDNTNGGLYEIRADVGNEVQLIRDGNNIKISSEQELKNVDINELTKEEKKDLQDGISGKNIVIDGEGKITADKKDSNNNDIKDDTIAKDNLPNTGRIILITIAVILSIIIVTSYVAYRNIF